MTTFYLDPVNGNDANDGLGWYKAAFTSGGIYEIQVGDTVTDDITAKTALVALVDVDSGTWAGGDAAGSLYVWKPSGAFTAGGNISVGTNSNVATLTADFAINSWKTWTLGATAARIAPGDTIRIAKSPDEVDSGVNGTFTNASDSITLSAALTKEICDCDSAWTASADVTDSSVSSIGYKTEGTYCRKFTIATNFTTGKIAYFDLGESKDFSAYQKISLTMTASADKAAGIFQVCLCSDATGDVPVDSLTVDQPLAYDTVEPSVTYLTLDKGSALGSSIRSIAIYALSDPGAISLYVDNIIACNDFSLNSLVGKQGEVWWTIRAITDDTTVYVGYGGSTNGKYVGDSETVAFYYRNPVPVSNVAVAKASAVESVMDSGTSGSPVTYSGGWNTSSGEQDGMTIYDAITGFGYGLYCYSKNYVRMENVGCVRAYSGVYISGSSYVYSPELHNILCAGCWGRGIYLSSDSVTSPLLGASLSGTLNLCNNLIGFWLSNTSKRTVSSAIIRVLGCTNIGTSNMVAYFRGYDHTFNGEIIVSASSSSSEAIALQDLFNSYFKKITIQGYGGYSLRTYDISYGYGCWNTLIEELSLEANVACLFGYDSLAYNLRIGRLSLNGNSIGQFVSTSPKSNNCSFFVDIYDASNRWKPWSGRGYISDQITGGQNAAWAYGGEGTCLYLDPASQTIPLIHGPFYFPVTAGVTYQIHFQVKKTSSEANCTLEIDRISGCGITEIRDESVSLTDSWAEHTSASFTPTYSGYVRCELHALDGSTTGDIGIDDIHLHTVS